MDRQADIQAGKTKSQTKRQVGWKAGRQRERWAGRQIFRQAKQKDRKWQVGWHSGRQRDRWEGRQTSRYAKQKDRQKGR